MIEVEKAEGIYLYGPKWEKKYIDLIAENRGQQCLDIDTRRSSKAIHKHWINTCIDVYGEYVQDSSGLLAKSANRYAFRFIWIMCTCVNSGSEAIEGAIKLAKRYYWKANWVLVWMPIMEVLPARLSVIGKWNFNALSPTSPGILIFHYGKLLCDLEKLIPIRQQCIVEQFRVDEAGNSGFLHQLLQKLKAAMRWNRTCVAFWMKIPGGFGERTVSLGFEHFNIHSRYGRCAKGMGVGNANLDAFIANKDVMAFQKIIPCWPITTFGGNPSECRSLHLPLSKFLQKKNLITEVESKQIFLKVFSYTQK